MTLDISVPLIVKNEERHIKECLDNLTWVKEVILVDTGSTDKTLEIAKEYENVKIFKEPTEFLVHFKEKDKWLFCFDKARNYALDRCTASYILILDADERIYNPEHLELLMTGEVEKTIDVWYLFQVSKLPSGKISPCMTTRFWKNHLGIKYDKMVHETVDGYVDTHGLKRGKSDLRIDHVGFINEEYSAEKSQRVIDAIEYEGHPYKNYYLGVAYAQAKDPDKAIEYLLKADEELLPFNIRAHGITLLADLFRQYSDYYKMMANERLDYSLKICPEQNLSYIIRAEMKKSTGENPLREIKKIKRRKHQTSQMHQDILLSDEEVNQLEKEFGI